MQNIEIELKFILNNPEGLKEKLEKIANPIRNEEYQKDIYYIPKHRNFLAVKPIAEWLRLRQTDKSASINYKNWHYEEGKSKAVSCDELETSVSDFNVITEILQKLDFSEAIVVEKKRTTWQYKKTEIALDEVTNLGTYIEIEAKGDFESKDEAIQYVYEIAKELDCDLGEQDYRGYPFKLLELNGYKFD